MSFMSFDYAMKAADAALQFQQSQSQNIKDTNQRVADVGKGNAQRKDQLIRQKIEAKYNKVSADIKAEKAEKLMQLAEKKKQNAAAAAVLVGGGHLIGGLFDAAFNKPKELETPDSQQMDIGGGRAEKLADFGYVSAAKFGADGNSENAGVVAFDPKKGNFSAFGINTTSGAPGKTDNVSAQDMAQKVWDKVKDSSDPEDQKLKSMISEGPPVMFKKEHFFQQSDGEFHLSDELRASMFGGNLNGQSVQGFFNQENGKQMVSGIIEGGYEVNKAYQTTADSMMGLLKTDKVQGELGLHNKTINKTEESLEARGLEIGWFDKTTAGAGKAGKSIFKAVSSGIQPFMQMAEAWKQYAEEYDAKKAEYEEAKKQAKAAAQKLLEIESQLVAAGAGT